jgi:hypothetical protein
LRFIHLDSPFRLPPVRLDMFGSVSRIWANGSVFWMGTSTIHTRQELKGSTTCFHFRHQLNVHAARRDQSESHVAIRVLLYPTPVDSRERAQMRCNSLLYSSATRSSICALVFQSILHCSMVFATTFVVTFTTCLETNRNTVIHSYS